MARLQHLGRPFQPLLVDLATIEQAYAAAGWSGKTAVSVSDAQKMARELFALAVEERASDIHIRVSKRERTRIFFRVHNDLEFRFEHPYEWGKLLCSAIYQSMTDVSDATFESINRQDARISERSKLPERLDGIRIATTPQVDGFAMVLRLLYNDTTDSVDLAALGYGEQQRRALELMQRRPTGINVIAGPTGSGKSTTLQRVLLGVIRACRGAKNVITVEDPPEYPIPGALQTPVTNAMTEEERSRAFQHAIKGSMRLDPDVIMIGEVRDTPSARLALQAAMTGHQVWTTLHANGAFAVLDRLVDLGVPVQLLTDAAILTGLVCQRLVKTLCPHCKVPLRDALGRYPDEDVRRVMSVVEVDRVYVRGEGCERCRKSGTAGRTVVAEAIATDHRLMSHLRAHDRQAAAAYWRQLGGITMLEDAIAKIASGTVDPFQAETIVGPLNTHASDAEEPAHA